MDSVQSDQSYRPNHSAVVAAVAFIVAALGKFDPAQGAETVWEGPMITFSKARLADWRLPSNQDQLTPGVALTRANTQGLFNFETESSYMHLQSPSGTEWAFGTTANFGSLTYQNWEAWTGLKPPDTVGRDAVVHLITEDLYLDLKFTSWGGTGGEFTYIRSTPSIPEPGSFILLSAGTALLYADRRRARTTSQPLGESRKL